MKFFELLNNRDELLRQARLANVAYAYQWLGDFAERIARAGLHGEVVLRGVDPDTRQPDPTLDSEEISRSVLEEHILEDEIAELADLLAFVHGAMIIVELRFPLEEVGTRFLPVLRRELEAANVLPSAKQASSIEDANQDAA